MTQTPQTGRTTAGRFTKGNSGRPKGARNRVSARAAADALRALNFEILDYLRRNHPDAFAGLIGALRPKPGTP